MTTHLPPVGNQARAYPSVSVRRTTPRTPVAVVLVLWLAFLVTMAVLLWDLYGFPGVAIGGLTMACPIGLCWDDVAARYRLWPWRSRVPLVW